MYDIKQRVLNYVKSMLLLVQLIKTYRRPYVSRYYIFIALNHNSDELHRWSISSSSHPIINYYYEYYILLIIYLILKRTT
jgi:hypothetical protein